VGEYKHSQQIIIMNKFYVSFLSLLAVGSGAFAQSKTQQPIGSRVKPTLDAVSHNVSLNRGGAAPLWSDDFSDPSNWVVGYAPGAPALNWQIGIGLTNSGSFPTAPVASTTASNGYAMLDSDGFANQSLTESSYMTTTDPIDLSAVDRVVLQFESFYRKWTDEECYIVISTNNTDWPALTPTTDISSMPNVFKAWPGMAVQAVINNPTLVRINISDAAGNQPQVWVRFHWTGTYGYSWFVDDVSIIEQPANDVVLNASYLSHTGNGEEYGRIPSSQLNPTMLVGAEVFNFGYDEQTDISLSLEVLNASNTIVFDFGGTESSIATTDTIAIEGNETLPTLATGLYRSIATVTSGQEQGGPFFSNNVHQRNFEITGAYYSLDGIGNHPTGYQALGSIGSNSFTGADDGLMIFSYYEIIEPLNVLGIEFLVRRNGSTWPGAAVIASIHDTTDILSNPVSVTNAIVTSEVYDITDADTTSGVVRVMFDQVQELTAGGYFAALELFSSDSAYPIRVIDDLTVPQPALASAIYDPSDNTVYTNGNAMSIRLILEVPNSIGDLVALEGVSLYPNPSNGVVNIHTAQVGQYTVEVFNMLGENMLTTVINGNTALDLSGNAKGVYMVRVSNDVATSTQRVILN